jgi:hypothetical protein
LRDIVRDYVVETLAAADAVLVIDETGFLKQGKASCGVARQYTGSAGVNGHRSFPDCGRLKFLVLAAGLIPMISRFDDHRALLSAAGLGV